MWRALSDRTVGVWSEKIEVVCWAGRGFLGKGLAGDGVFSFSSLTPIAEINRCDFPASHSPPPRLSVNCKRACAAAGTGRVPGMPGRTECRLCRRFHRELRLRVPQRRRPSRSLCRNRAPLRPRSRRHRTEPIHLGGKRADQPVRARRARGYLRRRWRQCVGGRRRRRQFPRRRSVECLRAAADQRAGPTGFNVAAGVAGLELEPVQIAPGYRFHHHMHYIALPSRLNANTNELFIAT